VDEVALVTAARSGDHEAYLRLAGLWQARVRAVAGGLAGPWRGEAIARATIAEAWRRLPTMPPAARFGPWLLTILHQATATGPPQAEAEPTPTGAAEPDRTEGALPGWTGERGAPRPAPAWSPPPGGPGRGDEPGPEDQVLLGLRAGLADLEAPEREAFLLAAVAGLGYEDVATVVGRPQSAVADDVYRARVRLAAVLADSTGGSR
jgi:DNA-directed RNA polymerase specialized sigma24 family protein